MSEVINTTLENFQKVKPFGLNSIILSFFTVTLFVHKL